MSHSIKGSKGPGFEYWGKRPFKGSLSPGKKTKVLTHKLERRCAEREIRKST